MRLWDLTGPDFEAADAEAWDMPLAGVYRVFGARSLALLFLGAALLYGLSGTTGLVLALSVHDKAPHGNQWIAFHLVAIAFSVVTFAITLLLSPHQMRRSAPLLSVALLATSPVLVAWGQWAAGPAFGIVALAYVQAPLFAFYVLRRPWAIGQASLLLATFGVVITVQDGWQGTLGAWLYVAGNVLSTAVVVAQIATRADELAASEHEARAELAELNYELEERVETQVAEIERLGNLRRFLSTQVADIVLTGNSTTLMDPHRTRIAVFFCDLRGFTAFTNSAEPEEVLGVLDEYYEAVGRLLRCYDATIGDYAGDGVMAYFGDPVPRDDSAMAAVAMTREVRGVMTGTVTEWQRRGYNLDYGVGLSYGYATLGVVGFDGRFDYKPVGGVVNLAARLCGKAAGGEILMDHATYAATLDGFPIRPVADLTLKGYAGATRAYSLE